MNHNLSSLAALLADQRESVIQRWISRLRADPSLPSADTLDEERLRNYIPTILDALIRSLALRANTGASGEASGAEIGCSGVATAHAHHRVADGYSLAEELRELSHLRAVIVDLCTREGVILTGEEAQLVHAAIDELMITAAAEVEQITAAQFRRDIALRELFIGILGHDLRNPLSVIIFAAASLLKREDVPESLTKVHRRIAASADRMRVLVAELLDLTRIRASGKLPIQPGLTDLSAIAMQILDEFGITHPERTFELEVEGDGCGEWDPMRLGQLVSNLVANAADYSPVDTPIRVAVRGRGDRVIFAVNNLGPSIPPDVQATIFDPFQRGVGVEITGKNHDGLGLGLFIVHEIVAAHGGSVEATSDPEAGTTFTVVLPRAPARGAR